MGLEFRAMLADVGKLWPEGQYGPTNIFYSYNY